MASSVICLASHALLGIMNLQSQPTKVAWKDFYLIFIHPLLHDLRKPQCDAYVHSFYSGVHVQLADDIVYSLQMQIACSIWSMHSISMYANRGSCSIQTKSVILVYGESSQRQKEKSNNPHMEGRIQCNKWGGLTHILCCNPHNI